MDERSYWCCLLTRDGAETLRTTLLSIIRQTVPPEFVVVIDDGSTDGTAEILLEISKIFSKLFVVRTNSKTRDIRRAPVLLNLGIAEAEKHQMTSFMMVSGDDARFPRNYCAEIMERMTLDHSVVVSSGSWGMATTMGLGRQPHGGGRFVRVDFMKTIGGRYPATYGWETWLVFKAMEKGFLTKNYDDLRYDHLRPFKPKNVYGWGRAMYSLGYPFYFVLFRFLRNLLVARGQIGINASFSMLAGYLASLLNPRDIDGMVIHDRPFKRFVKRACTSRLTEII